ncbi:MAG TPA: globin family protein [Stellaceae bacterium]|nr:globin family protein [Stellaceae bacterium]
MTPRQVALVQASFARVAPIAEQAAALFYGRLFETAPETRALFSGDMVVQGQKLMGAITTVVTNLDDLGAVVPVAQALAKRHVGYGVRPEHYEPVGAALLWTLEQGLGGDFTADVSAAWAAAYGALSGAMIAAAYPES